MVMKMNYFYFQYISYNRIHIKYIVMYQADGNPLSGLIHTDSLVEQDNCSQSRQTGPRTTGASRNLPILSQQQLAKKRVHILKARSTAG